MTTHLSGFSGLEGAGHQRVQVGLPFEVRRVSAEEGDFRALGRLRVALSAVSLQQVETTPKSARLPHVETRLSREQKKALHKSLFLGGKR